MLRDKFEIQEALDKIDFLNFKFTISDFSNSIRIQYKARDNEDRAKVTEILSEFMIPFHIPLENLYEVCFDNVVKVLTHEASELFKIKGRDFHNAPFNEHFDYSAEERKTMIYHLFNWVENN